MPELPEVETIRRHLAPWVEGRRIAAMEVLDPRWCAPVDPPKVVAGMTGRRVEGLGRRGKYLLWELGGGAALIVHLRMTGTLLYGAAAVPHTRVRVALDDGGEVAFVDPRRFGTGVLAPDPAARDAYLDARLGLEPLDPAFTVEHLRTLARGCRAPAKAFLLDQSRIAGLGNIYADEALHRAGVHPTRPAHSLKRPQLERLHAAVVDVLEEGIAARGATIDDFRHPDGAWGSFQDRFRVHRRAGEPCPACGAPVVKTRVGQRGTYLCRRCQPAPRRARGGAATPARASRPRPAPASPAR